MGKGAGKFLGHTKIIESVSVNINIRVKKCPFPHLPQYNNFVPTVLIKE
jgi:hypothetical protein